jgi:membrane protease YdiL (CAAX protease family)
LATKAISPGRIVNEVRSTGDIGYGELMEEQDQPYERVSVYGPASDEPEHLTRFKNESRNENFRVSKLTWLSLFFLIILYPGVSLLTAEDPSIFLKNLNNTLLMTLLVVTIIVQWTLFAWLLLSMWRENTDLAGLGFRRIRAIDFAWGIAFLLAANLVLSGLVWILGQIGMPMSGEIALLVPQDTAGRIVWVLVSLTAGITEETMFRGYLMTRLRLVFKLPNWVLPTIISAVAFGACHAYQGLPGLIVISVYGAMFSLLFIRTGSLWPCIIAHFFQDFSALFIPQ